MKLDQGVYKKYISDWHFFVPPLSTEINMTTTAALQWCVRGIEEGIVHQKQSYQEYNVVQIQNPKSKIC